VSQGRRREAAVEEVVDKDALTENPVQMLEPNDHISFQRPGVQHGVFKNLRLGRYSIDAVLDMHRMTKEEARKALWSFVKDCVEHDVRTALITHGKGEGRKTPALLKSCVAHWLPEMPEVLAYHTAQRQHGSYGATYVLLRKSDKKKLQNKYDHQGR
jgi:DNA-nicking Smr family endonuclease